MRRTTLAFVVLGLTASSAGAREEARSHIVGHALLDYGGLPIKRGSIQLTVRGVAYVSGDCPDADSNQFVAIYRGELTVDEGHSYDAPLFVDQITTPSGCPIESFQVQEVSDAIVSARLGNLWGYGGLTFQMLTSADADAVRHGDFGDLYADLTFRPPPPPCDC